MSKTRLIDTLEKLLLSSALAALSLGCSSDPHVTSKAISKSRGGASLSIASDAATTQNSEGSASNAPDTLPKDSSSQTEASSTNDDEAVSPPEYVHGAYLMTCGWLLVDLELGCQIKARDGALPIKTNHVGLKVVRNDGTSVTPTRYKTIVAKDKNSGAIKIMVTFLSPVYGASLEVVNTFTGQTIGKKILDQLESLADALPFQELAAAVEGASESIVDTASSLSESALGSVGEGATSVIDSLPF